MCSLISLWLSKNCTCKLVWSKASKCVENGVVCFVGVYQNERAMRTVIYSFRSNPLDTLHPIHGVNPRTPPALVRLAALHQVHAVLLLPFDLESPDDAVTFYKPTDGKAFTKKILPCTAIVVCGSSHGWSVHYILSQMYFTLFFMIFMLIYL